MIKDIKIHSENIYYQKQCNPVIVSYSINFFEKIIYNCFNAWSLPVFKISVKQKVGGCGYVTNLGC